MIDGDVGAVVAHLEAEAARHVERDAAREGRSAGGLEREAAPLLDGDPGDGHRDRPRVVLEGLFVERERVAPVAGQLELARAGQDGGGEHREEQREGLSHEASVAALASPAVRGLTAGRRTRS